MSKAVPPSVSEYMATIGRKGGRAGKGTKKARGDAVHYKRLKQMAKRRKK